jgi:hypothetical protein
MAETREAFEETWDLVCCEGGELFELCGEDFELMFYNKTWGFEITWELS